MPKKTNFVAVTLHTGTAQYIKCPISQLFHKTEKHQFHICMICVLLFCETISRYIVKYVNST